jgi:hypothetical protein
MSKPSAAAATAAAAEKEATANPAATGTADVKKTGYTGFGSFHSDDVEILVRQDAATYRPPALPFPNPAEQQEPVQDSRTCQHSMQSTAANEQQYNSNSNDSSSSAGAWGVEARSQFQIDFKNWTFINHGAFGGASRQV